MFIPLGSFVRCCGKGSYYFQGWYVTSGKHGIKADLWYNWDRQLCNNNDNSSNKTRPGSKSNHVTWMIGRGYGWAVSHPLKSTHCLINSELLWSKIALQVYINNSCLLLSLELSCLHMHGRGGKKSAPVLKTNVSALISCVQTQNIKDGAWW